MGKQNNTNKIAVPGLLGCSGVPLFRDVPGCSGVPRRSVVPVFRCSSVLVFLVLVHAVFCSYLYSCRVVLLCRGLNFENRLVFLFYTDISAGSKENFAGKTGRIDQFRYIKIQPKTIHLSTRLWGINPTNSVFIPQSLVMRSIVLG